MIVILKQNAEQNEVNALLKQLEDMGFDHHYSKGENSTIVGIIGDTSTLDTDDLKTIDVVADVKRVSEPFKLANRKFHPDNSIFNIAGRTVGEGHFSVIAGPCSVETIPQMTETAEAVKKSGASFLRGGAFKPRTSPYSFQGLHLSLIHI